MEEVMASCPASVGSDPGVRVFPSVEGLVVEIEADEARGVRDTRDPAHHEDGRSDHQERGRQRGEPLLPTGREVVALAVVPRVLYAKDVSAVLVAKPSVDAVLEEGPGERAEQRCQESRNEDHEVLLDASKMAC